MAVDVLERPCGLLHGRHRLRIEARRLEGVHLHLQLEPRALQPLELLLRRLLALQGRRRRYTPRPTGRM